MGFFDEVFCQLAWRDAGRAVCGGLKYKFLSQRIGVFLGSWKGRFENSPLLEVVVCCSVEPHVERSCQDLAWDFIIDNLHSSRGRKIELLHEM